MAKAKTTRELSDAHENWLADTIPGGRRSKTSGASSHDPIDVTTDFHVIEAKATEGESISIKKSTWQTIRQRAHDGRIPAIALRFKDPYNNTTIDLLCIEVYDELELRHDKSC
jgi:hypothetical protein